MPESKDLRVDAQHAPYFAKRPRSFDFVLRTPLRMTAYLSS